MIRNEILALKLGILHIDKLWINTVMLTPYSPSPTNAILDFDPRDPWYDKNEVIFEFLDPKIGLMHISHIDILQIVTELYKPRDPSWLTAAILDSDFISQLRHEHPRGNWSLGLRYPSQVVYSVLSEMYNCTRGLKTVPGLLSNMIFWTSVSAYMIFFPLNKGQNHWKRSKQYQKWIPHT